MARAPQHAVSWSAERGLYAWSTQGHVVHQFDAGDNAAWLTWLGAATSFAFHGRLGSLNVYLEKRQRGGRYWYAYHTDRHGIRKRYLGQTAQVTLARLEATAQSLAGASPPPAQADASSSPGSFGSSGPSARRAMTELLMLLGTKLSPPLLPNALVERPRLLAALDGSLSTPLTLLSASAGWGKTTLLAAWARSHEESLAWLSLDELDNTPTRFWVALIAALRSAASAPPDLGERALGLLLSPQPPPSSASVAVLLRDLEHLEGRVAHTTSLVVVLDDYQVISDPAIHESLTFWLEHLPAHVHVVLASRVDPDLPLARLRVRRQLTELRTADLHFRPEEASALLQQAVGAGEAPLSDEQVAALQRRTEGWAAGLQLAALSLRQRQQDDRAAWLAAWTGGQRYLLDYVQEEILDRQPGDLQHFLLHTAVLTRLSAPVCQAVLAAPNAQACQKTLEVLERANLFVVPLDEERRWYRVHDLFREALLARLSAHEPALLPELHLRAARWYEHDGDLQEAIAHALAAPDFAYAARLMERAAPSCWLRGEAQLVQGWMAALPDGVLWQYAPLALRATLNLLESLHNTTETAYARAQAQVEHTLTHLEALLRQHQHRERADRLEDTATPSARPERAGELLLIGRRLRLLRALIEARASLRRADKAHLVQLAEELEQLCQGEDITWQMVARRLDFWLTEAFEREGALLISRLIEAREQAEQDGDLLARLRVRAWLAHLYVHAAQWPQVERECLAGLALVAQSGVRTSWAGYLQSSLAEAYYAWNRLDEAASALHEELCIAEEWQQVDLLIDSQLNLTQVHVARGDLAAADEALCHAESLVQREPFAHLPSTVSAFRVRYWLAAGDLEAARHWAEQVAFSLDPHHWEKNNFLALLMLVRVHLAQRQYPQTLDLLERFRAQLDQPDNVWRTVEWLPVYVVALHQAGRPEQADTVLSRLLALTEPTGSLRVYLDQCEPMRQALQAFRRPHSREPGQQEPSPAIAAYVARLLTAFQDGASGAGRSNVAAPVFAPHPARAPIASAPDSVLTRREQDVLRLLAEGASNQDIAQALVISLATVKKHVSSLLSKLGAISRTQAIAQARARTLL